MIGIILVITTLYIAIAIMYSVSTADSVRWTLTWPIWIIVSLWFTLVIMIKRKLRKIRKNKSLKVALEIK